MAGTSSIQGKLWSAAARDWACLQEPFARPAWELALRLAGVGAGTRFFDGGCGAGGACLVAARLGARVAGLDAAPALVEIARERLPDATFDVGELQDLAVPPGSFDVVLASNALQYTADPGAAVASLAAVLGSRGVLAVIQWGRPERCEMDRAVFPAVRAVAPPPAGTPAPMNLSDPALLDGLIRAAGLRIAGDETVAVPMEYPSLDDAWRAQRSAGPLQRGIGVAGEEAVRNAVVEALRPYLQPSGMVRMRNEFRVVIARPS